MEDAFFRRAQRAYLEEPTRRPPRVRAPAAAVKLKGGKDMQPVLTARGRALVEAHMGLARRMAAGAGGGETEDLFAAACLGLCEAAAAWNGKCAFEPFAAAYIAREIKTQQKLERTTGA